MLLTFFFTFVSFNSKLSRQTHRIIHFDHCPVLKIRTTFECFIITHYPFIFYRKLSFSVKKEHIIYRVNVRYEK